MVEREQREGGFGRVLMAGGGEVQLWRALQVLVVGRSGAPGSLFRQSLAKVLPVEGKGLAARPTFPSRSPRRFPAFESLHTILYLLVHTYLGSTQ